MTTVFRTPTLHLNDARAKKAELKAKAHAMLDTAKAANRDLDSTEQKQFNALTVELHALDARIDEHLAAAHTLTPDQGMLTASPSASLPSIGSQLRVVYERGSEDVRAQIDGLAAALAGRPRSSDILATADLRPAADGGVIIPSAVQTILERNYAAFAPVVSVARLFPTETGETTTFPVLSDSESAVQLDAAASTGADATVSGDAPPTSITGPTLKAWKVSSKPVFVPRELATDSPIAIIQEVVGALLARIIRFENLKFTKGAGTTEASGFMTGATSMHAGSGAVLSLDIALDLAYSVPALYRPNGVYMASDTTIKFLRKLKTGIDGDLRSLWKDAFEEGNATLGTPAKLHGYPIIVNNDMDPISSDGTFTGAAPLAFGDFSKFVVRQAENNSPYAYIYPVPAKDGRAAILFRRSDSTLLVSAAISKLVE